MIFYFTITPQGQQVHLNWFFTRFHHHYPLSPKQYWNMWCDYATWVFSCWLLHCCVLWLCWLSNFGKGQSWVFLNLTKIIIITIGQSVSCVACAWTEKFSIHPTSAHSLFYLCGYYATGSFTIGIKFLNELLRSYLLVATRVVVVVT